MDALTILYLALLAGGTYTTYKANKDAQQRANAQALEAQRRQSELTKEAGTKTLKYAGDTFTPETRAQNEQQAAANAEAQLMQNIAQARDSGVGKSSKTGGRISGQYNTARAKNVARQLERAATLASLMGKVRGPQDLRFQEGIQGARLGGELNDLQSLARSRGTTDASIYDLVSRPNPGQLALGSLMSGVGSAGAMGQLTSTTAPAGTPTGAAAHPGVATAPAQGGGWYYPNTNPWANYKAPVV